MDLGKTSLFRGAAEDDLAAVQRLAVRKDLLPGDQLFSPGQPARGLYLIEMGSVEVRAKDKEMRLVALGGGQIIGEVAFFAPGEHAYSASAVETTRLLEIPGDALHRLLDERPALAQIVYRNAARQFAQVLRQIGPLLDHPYV